MNDNEREELRRIFEDALKNRAGIDMETHRLHHAFVRDELERRKRNREKWDDIRKAVFIWGIIAALGAFSVGVYDWFRDHFGNGQPPYP